MGIPAYETLTLELDGAVATVALARPERANAMSLTMWAELQQCFEWLDAEPAVRVVILAGQGRHFCAGIDLGDLGAAVFASGDREPARAAEELRRLILRLQDNLTSIERCRKPVLAAIQGACVGGGVDLVACCDMRYCSEDAYFSIKEIDIGMTADVGTLQRLPHLVGRGMLHELAYTGRRVGGDEARELQLVNRVFPDCHALLAGVHEIAAVIASKSPLAIRGTKEMLLYARDHTVADGLNYVATWNAAMLSQRDVMATLGAGGEGPAFED